MAFNIIYKSNDEEEEKKRKKLIEEGANQQRERNRQANEQFNRNYEERNNFFNNVGRVADSFLTGLGTTAANVGTGVLSVINDNPVNLATRSARDNLIGKIENTDLAGYAEKLKAIKNPTEQRIDWLSDIKRQNEAKIQNLQSQTDSEVAKNIIGFVPNLSQQAVNIGASLVNPGLGMAVASAGAKGSYLDVAKQRGMNEEESRTFSNIMAVVEGATEMIGINNITKGIKGVNALAKTGIKGAKKELQKEIVDTAIKSYGKSILDNAVQEAITEPIQEAVADITAKKGDWNNVLGRSLESGFSGALTAAITGGVSMGISSAVGYVQKVTNGYKPTQAETIQAVNQIYNEATENQKQVLDYAIKDGVEIATQQSILPIEENVLKSNVETNNTILDSAERNGIDVKDEKTRKNLETIQKFNENRGIEATFDADAFKGHDNINSFFRTDENGNREIVFNPNTMTDKTIQQLAVHEVYHDMVAGGTAQELTDLVVQKMSGNQEYQDYINALQDVYGEQDSDIIKEEAVAHYLEKNLGTNEFITELQQRGDRTTIQKIIDAIKDMITKVKNTLTGKGDLNYLLDLKRKYEQAYRGEFKGTQEQTKLSKQVNKYQGSHQIDTENSISLNNLDLNDIESKVKQVNGALSKQDISDLNKLKKLKDNDTITIYRASPVNELNNGDWVTTDKSYAQNVAKENGGKVYSYEVNANELLYPNNVKDLPSLHRLSSFQYNSQDNIQENTISNQPTADNQGNINNRGAIDNLNNYLKDNNFELQTNGNLKIENLTNKQIKSLLSLYKTTGYEDVSTDYLNERLKQGNFIIPREVADKFIKKELGYKPKFDTLQIYEDSEGNKLTKEQVEFYKDSDIRDIRGRLIPVYHRTNADFTVFDNKAGKQHGNKYGKGFYFSITPENYGNNTMKVYLNAKEGEYRYIPDKGYYIVQNANQIKNVDNTNPTENADIRYSKEALTKDNQGRELSKRQQEYFKNSKVRDENGNLLTLYHGSPNVFTEFDTNKAKYSGLYGRGLYFAYGYQNTWASAISTKTDAKNPKTYEVYLNITNPFSIQDETAKRIYLDEYVKGGNSLYLDPYSDNTDYVNNLDEIDWTEGEDLREWLKENHPEYDGLILDEGGDGGYGEAEYRWRGKSYVTFSPDQIKNIDNTTPTDNPDINLSKQGTGTSQDTINNFLENTKVNEGTGTAIKDLAKVQKQSKQILPTTPAEEVTEMERPQLPQVNEVKQRQAEPITQPSTQPVLPISETKAEMGQRKTYKTIAENINQPQEVRDIAQSLRETNLYQKKKNSEVLAQAKNKIKNVGADNLLNDLTERVNNNQRLSTEDTGALIELLDYYGKNGDTQRAETTLQNLAMSGTETAQALQIQRALNHMTPQGQAIWIQRSADKLNKSMLANKKATIQTIDGEQRIIDRKGNDITDKTPLFKFTPEMQQKLLNSTSENMYDVIDNIYEEMGQQVPKSKMEQFDEWRYFSMLGNPKTHIRNSFGNITMEGQRQVKNKIAGAIEDAYYSVTGKEGERTHTLRFADKKTKDFAKQDVKNRDVQTMLGVTEDKYNPQSRLKQSQRTFKSNFLENTVGKAEKLNTKLLSKEDVSVLGIAGLEPAYRRSLVEYITANRLDVDTMTDKQLQKAREYAVTEAKEATFHTYNKIASMINTLENKNLATKILVGGILPFKQTPMNVAIQGFEYSPAGLLKTLTYDTVQLKNGNINANQYINKISKGLTGTGIALLGYALTSAGILKASGSGDDKDDYEKAQGKQTYSIKIGDNTYTLDWLAPAGIPLFIGSELYQISKADAEEKKGGNATQSEIAQSAENIFNAMTTTMNPMTEMTMLSGLTSTLKSYANDPAQALGNILINTGKSYVTQSVPTALGQVARSTDDKERSTSSTESNVFTKAIDSTKNQIMSKVPGLRQLLPVATDVWGNEAKSKNYIENAILPANRKEIKEEPLDKELTRLYDATGESSVIPDTYIDKTLTIAKEKYRLSNEEYADLKKQYGQTSYKILSNLTSSSDYKNMTDEQKVKAVTEAYKYAKASLKVTYADWNNLDADANSTYKKVQNVIDKGGDAKDYFTYVGLTDGLKTETEKNRALRDSDLGSKSAIYESTTGSDDQIYPIMKKAKTNINAYLDYKLADIQGIKNEEGKTISGSKKQAFNDYLNSSKMNYNQRLLLKGVNYKLTNYEKNLLLDYLDTLKLSDNEYNDVLLKLK